MKAKPAGLGKRARAKERRILILNPNTNASMTSAIEKTALEVASEGTILLSTTARFGVHVICSRVGVALAGHASLDAYAAFAASNPAMPVDGVVLACFGAESTCLEALREMTRLPCTGMAEAGCFAAAEACSQSHPAGKFSIVTGGKAWEPMLREYVQSLGLGERLASIRVLEANGAEILAAPNPAEAADNIYRAAQQAVEEDGAELILLSGAGMVGQVWPLQERLGVPVMDGLTPAIRRAEDLICDAAAADAKRPNAEHKKDCRCAHVATTALGTELEAMLTKNHEAR